jgi:translation initiation factor 2 subunit 1
MPSANKEEWPEPGELVMTSVSRITRYGVYVMLDEYEKEGFLHISEISSSWVKNIRDYVHEGAKTILKVLRIDPERQHIDLSLRRVTRRERREKAIQWKQTKKAESLMRSASQRLEVPLEEVYEKAWVPLEEAYGEAYEGLEQAAKEGVEVLLKAGLPKELAEVLAEVAKDKIKISLVKIRGTMNISCPKPDGVDQIKEALLKAQRVKVSRGAEVRIYTVAPPKYRIEVTAHDRKEATDIIKKATDIAVETITKAGGEGVFERG